MRKLLKAKFTSRLFVVIMLTGLLFIPANTNAQLNTSFNDSLSVNVSPSTPGPNTKTTIRLVDYSTDLDRANISWAVNGKTISSGVGEKSFTFITSDLGKSTSVTFVITTTEGVSYQDSRTFIPAGLDLVWEASSIAPSTYKGKKLAPSENLVKITAIPYFLSGGVRISAERLIYEWEKDFELVPGLSGVGKNTASIKISSIFGNTTVKVTATTPDGNVQASTRITIDPANPFVLVYNVDPLSGIDYDHPLGREVELNKEEITLVAQPFFFPIAHLKEPGLRYTWGVNGQRVTTDEERPRLITLRQGVGAGESNISLSIKDPFDILITAATGFLVRFNSSGSFQ